MILARISLWIISPNIFAEYSQLGFVDLINHLCAVLLCPFIAPLQLFSPPFYSPPSNHGCSINLAFLGSAWLATGSLLFIILFLSFSQFSKSSEVDMVRTPDCTHKFGDVLCSSSKEIKANCKPLQCFNSYLNSFQKYMITLHVPFREYLCGTRWKYAVGWPPCCKTKWCKPNIAIFVESHQDLQKNKGSEPEEKQ